MSESEKLYVSVDGDELVTYQAGPMSDAKGGEKFPVSNFIHPLKTPSGFVVTDCQPGDHLHHLGLWWPWKYLEIEGRKVLCWELQYGDGIIQAQHSSLTSDGFTAKSVFTDRRNPDGPQTLLNETANIKLSHIMEKPAHGYYLDVEIIHEVAAEAPVTVAPHLYSGFTFRGTSQWDKDTSTLLTSEGIERDGSNKSRAKWVRVEGGVGAGKTAGVLLMSHKGNHDHPEHLRTWESNNHNGAVFVNFNTVQEDAWLFEKGNTYVRNFRVFVYDGSISKEQAEEMWEQYAL